MTKFEDFVYEHAREQMRRNSAVIEQACEAALQTGVCGVMVTRHDNGTVAAEVSADVPYGTIHEYLK